MKKRKFRKGSNRVTNSGAYQHKMDAINSTRQLLDSHQIPCAIACSLLNRPPLDPKNLLDRLYINPRQRNIFIVVIADPIVDFIVIAQSVSKLVKFEWMTDEEASVCCFGVRKRGDMKIDKVAKVDLRTLVR